MMTVVYSCSDDVLELPFEQLRRAAQSAERILDLMRELANHRAAATELGQQRVFARDALVVRRVGKLDDDTARASGRIEWRHGCIEHAWWRARPRLERDLATRILCARGSRSADHAFQFVIALEQVAHRAPCGLVAADAEHVFGRFVQVHHGAVGIEPHD